MIDPKKFLNDALNDIRIEVKDEFDRNFERKAFFDKKWPKTKLTNRRGSLMLRTGSLRQSINAEIQGNSIVFSSSLPYASIHNEGGEITVTAKMKAYFWAMYKQATGGLELRKDGKARNTQRNRLITQEAEQWKGLALMKIGQKIKIEQRQFIGPHPEVDDLVEDIVDEHMEIMMENIQNKNQ